MEAKGEVRRLHIIYFLSNIGGRADHPHLIRVLHLARNGVYLRDVKRWLGELRGKDMPEAFSWSYKRRYKSGYVWQDLLDDDLITPISDNEYVLKGSQIHPTPFENFSPNEKSTNSHALAEKKSPQVHVTEEKQQQPSLLEEESRIIRRYTESKTDTPTKVSLEISQDSLVFSSERWSSVTTDEYESCKAEEEKEKPLVGSTKECCSSEKKQQKLENSVLPSLYHNLLSKSIGNKEEHNKTDTPDSSFSTSSSSSSQSSFSKLRSSSNRVSMALRNWISCGTVDTNDAALIRMRASQKIDSSNESITDNLAENKAQICKGDKFGGSARCFRTWNNGDHQPNQHGARKSFDGEETNGSRKKLGDFMNQTRLKPLAEPICSS
ncbi:hypothetical protein PIB30_054729 [Stylosanthes scabra]|uniref:SOSEKI DIX-like domain-containing protein n=1 Tax=Stylosanthes scabra TaxID=79078 RepID=A0ABU6RJ87_9FABA|nr:hypothetical protein [Stylosanthes scabra]